MVVARSISLDPVFNLELERTLLERREGDFLLLYINSPSVVVGRNQSPEAEADLNWCAEKGIPVLRRVSGGGAVYHDRGNINYAFIGPRTAVSVLDAYPAAPVVAALVSMGVRAVAGPRGGLTVGGLKISGTASRVTARRQMFHGTLLHSSDLCLLNRALKGDPALRGRRIASVPAEVTNIARWVGGTPEEFLVRLADFFMHYYGGRQKSTVIYAKNI